ncbi:ArnT family glycosyltransferase [Agreia bicolorata]|uniref:4-amino-4-deoxy-L-arabinose transferase n=1 Tax=Agreia bicolorata TaxID=110935 RepID=A0ABR5CCJ4_9MICO|nr:glycosyltransferase family 39 protein [Agreia bicolorata]KJC63331.1 4-amino-4-deoxy-L-arabinose transferase [Agreia bicolorata]
MRSSNTDSLPRWWGQPWRFRTGLVVVLVVSASLMVWNLAKGGDASFYEASARSMSESWHAMLFGAFDPASTVTLDKLSGFAVPQALSIRLFGMSTSALALPQVLEGLVTVWCCSVIGLRWAGPGAGLIAAAAAATTPIFVSMFAHPMEDGLVTMALTVALLFFQRALLTARWWPLLVAALFVGVGFQAKMMQAWFILPAFVIGCLLWMQGGWLRRLWRSAVVSATAVAASLVWVIVLQLTPADDRPYIDGSTNNNAFAMVFGYNGVDRLLPHAVPGAVGGSGAHALAAPVLFASPSDLSAAGASLTKLIDPLYVTQVGWLYPIAIAAIVFGLIYWWPRRAATPSASFAMLGVVAVWLITATAVLSVAHTPHTAYVAAIGTQLAMLAAVGWKQAVRLLRAPSRRTRLAVCAVLLVQGVWSVFLAIEGALPPVLAVPMAAVCGACCVALAATGWRSRSRPSIAAPRHERVRATAVPLLAAALILSGPTAFSLQVVDPARSGSGGDAYVGIKPTGTETNPPSFRPSLPQLWGGSATLSPQVADLVKAAREAGGGVNGAPDFVTDSWALAAQVIDATGDSVLTDGGYSGTVPVFTEPQLEQMIASGAAHVLAVKQHAPTTDPVEEIVQNSTCTRLGTFTTGIAVAGPKSGSVVLWDCG